MLRTKIGTYNAVLNVDLLFLELLRDVDSKLGELGVDVVDLRVQLLCFVLDFIAEDNLNIVKVNLKMVGTDKRFCEK